MLPFTCIEYITYFIILINKYLLNTYYVPEILLDFDYWAVNKTQDGFHKAPSITTGRKLTNTSVLIMGIQLDEEPS